MRTGTMHAVARRAILLPLLGLSLVADVVVAAGADDDTPPVAASGIGQAKAAIAAERYDRAIEVLEALAAADPDDADVHNLLGYSHRQSGRLDRAKTHYDHALTLDPEHLGAHEYIGELYLAMDHPTLAEQHLSALRRSRACRGRCEEYEDLAAAIERYRERPRD